MNITKKPMAKSNVTIQHSSKSNAIKLIPIYVKLLVLLISLLSFIIYYQSVNFEYTLDDRMYTTDNEVTQAGLDRISDIFKYGSLNFFKQLPTNTGTYRPITLLTFAFEFELYDKFDPKISHLVNVFLYSLIIFFLGIVLLRLYNKKDINYILPLSILLLFATHPIHIEAVASVKSRDTLLAGFFVVISLLLFDKSTTSKNKTPIILSAISFFLAVLSKEDAITFVAVIFLIPLYFEKINPLLTLKRTVLFFLVAMVYLFIRFMVLDRSENEGLNSILNNIIYDTEGAERLATNLFVWLHYLKLVLFPYPLSWDYSYNQIPIVSFSNIYPYIGISVFLSLLIIAYKSYKSRNLIGFGILFYLITFSIYSNLFQKITIGTTLAERFLFIPVLGLIISFVTVLNTLENKYLKQKLKLILPSIAISISILYSIMLVNQIGIWKDNKTLFASGINSSPNSWRTHAYYATILRQEAMNIINDSNNLGDKEKAKSLLAISASELEKSITIYRSKASGTGDQIILGDIYLLLNDTLRATNSYQIALEINPNEVLALKKMAILMYQKKEYNKAVKLFEKLIPLDPSNKGPYLERISNCYIQMNEYKFALDAFEKNINFNLNSQKISVMLRLSQIINDKSKIQYYQKLQSNYNQ